MLHMHAPVFAPPRKHPPADERAAKGSDAEFPAAKRASDAARTRNPLGGPPFTPADKQTFGGLLVWQTTVAQPLSPSVAQPTPPSVARRSAQKKGRARVQKEGKALPASRGADFAGHAGVRHLVHNSGLSSKHAALAQHAAMHTNNGHAFRTKRCARRRRLQAAIAVAMSAAVVNETAAAFAPNWRSELQAATFGCVGACGQALSGSGDRTYCSWNANGPWESGDGTTCANAYSQVPSGQGDGKYGAIGSWIVSKVTDMYGSECTTVHVSSPVSISLSLFHF